MVKDPRNVQSEIFRRVEAFHGQQRQEEIKRRQAEMLDWFSAYHQVHESIPDESQNSPPEQEEP